MTARAQADVLIKKKTNSADPIKTETVISEDCAASGKETDRFPLVTGATGFFGIHLVKELIDSGCEKVFCLMRDPNPARLTELLV